MGWSDVGKCHGISYCLESGHPVSCLSNGMMMSRLDVGTSSDLGHNAVETKTHSSEVIRICRE